MNQKTEDSNLNAIIFFIIGFRIIHFFKSKLETDTLDVPVAHMLYIALTFSCHVKVRKAG